MTNIFDTHAHYDDEAFDADRDALFDALPGQQPTPGGHGAALRKSGVSIRNASRK